MARRKMWTMMGHSIGEGGAGSSPMIAAAPYLQTITASPQRVLYPGIYAWTAKAGWSGSGGTPPSFSPAAGEFLTLTTNAPTSPAGAHPHPSPYNYPNTRSFPISPGFYIASDTGGGSWTGIELALSWHMSNAVAGPLYFNKLCIPGSSVLRRDTGMTDPLALAAFGVPTTAHGADYPGGLNSHFAWFTPADKFDYQPGTDRLFGVWEARMHAAVASIENGTAPECDENDEADLDLVILWFGDNDCSSGGDRIRAWKADILSIIKRIRELADANNWSSKPGYQIPFVLMKINEHYGTEADRDAMNAALDEIAAEDPYVRARSTDEETLTEAGFGAADPVRIGPSTHLSHNAYLELAKGVFDDWQDMQTDPLSALNMDELIDVAEAKARVTTYFEKSRERTDAGDDVLLQHINGALHHIENKLGDNCYWLRQRRSLSVTQTNQVVTLPPYISRVLRLESTADVTCDQEYQLLGFSAGRQQVYIPNGTGAYHIHYIAQSRDLVTDGQKVPLPAMCLEWLVVEACRRLARASNNLTLMDSLAAEANALMEDVGKHASLMQRAFNTRVSAQRELRGRIGTQSTNTTGRDRR